jgi:tRNA 2-selenouridine synthase
MIHRMTIHDLVKMPESIPFMDTRTPAEFRTGHIPDAFNIPLFSNEERALVGATYKQQGKEAAILLGFDLTGSKWAGFIRQALGMAPQKKIGLHCWRGGMRSAAMAWALDLYGFEVYLLEGGYKNYRKWVQRQFDEPYLLQVIGGRTGSGKTRILYQLRAMGEQVIDLEGLAQHKGSTYGSINKLVQPSQEQFENDLAGELQSLDHSQRIWVEDESITIGKRLIPHPFWNRMQSACLFDLQIPEIQRITALVNEYGSLDKDFLVACTDRIRKRLGLEQTKQAIAAIREDRMDEFVRLVLVYYDKTYRLGLDARHPTRIFPLPAKDTDPIRNACQILDLAQTLPAGIETTIV